MFCSFLYICLYTCCKNKPQPTYSFFILLSLLVHELLNLLLYCLVSYQLIQRVDSRPRYHALSFLSISASECGAFLYNIPEKFFSLNTVYHILPALSRCVRTRKREETVGKLQGPQF